METITEAVAAKPVAVFANDVLKTIYTRRAVRKFKDKPVKRELIEQVLEAGRMAPSAINKQPWKFYILTDKEKIKLFAKETAKAAAKGFLKSGIKNIIKTGASLIHFSTGLDISKVADPIFHGAPVVIFITSPKSNEWAQLDIGMCCQNMMLAAKSLGLDSCPVGMGKFVEQAKIFSTMNVPVTEKVDISIILGYGDETPELHERNKTNAIYI